MELLKKWLGHPEDIYNLLRFKMGGYRAVMPRNDPVSAAGGAQGGMRLGVPVSRALRGEGGGCHLAARLRRCRGRALRGPAAAVSPGPSFSAPPRRASQRLWP